MNNSQIWNYTKHGSDWNLVDGNLCDELISNQAPLKLNSTNMNYLAEDLFFFADSNTDIKAEFKLQDNNNNLALVSDKNLTKIHTNLFQVDISGKKLNVFYDIGCKQIYFRIPGEHLINGKKYDMEMQFNCTAVIKDFIQGQSTENTFNFFVAYPINISDEKRQLSFFDDVYNKGNLKLNDTLSIRDIKEIMNNYNMFNKMYFYRGSKNFFDCMLDFYWLVVDNQNLSINSETLNLIKSLIDKTQAPEGNNRIASDPSDTEVLLLNNKFN